jgi:hypothetical protein
MFRDSRLNRLPLVLLLLLPVLNGCAVSKPHAELPPDIAKQRIGELQLAILALGDGVDTDESLRAAKIAFEYSKQLARKYEVTDSAIVHNLKVNLGIREPALGDRQLRDRFPARAQHGCHQRQRIFDVPGADSRSLA